MVTQRDESDTAAAPRSEELASACVVLDAHLGRGRFRGRVFFGSGRKGDIEIRVTSVKEDE